MKLRISHTDPGTTLLGPEKRFVIWVHGCCFDCPGCLAQNIRNSEYQIIETECLADQIIASGVEGLTVSGGEPFLQAKALAALIRQIRQSVDMGVIVYSGFTFEQLCENAEYRELLSATDILIDGPYIRELDDGRPYVGSSNQRVLYLSDRYLETGPVYYGTGKRRAEIKMLKDRLVLVGVPGPDTLEIWKKIKKRTAGGTP